MPTSDLRRDSDAAPRTGDGPAGTGVVAGGRRLALSILRQVLLDPMRGGRLGWRGMPSSLRAVTALGMGTILVLLAMIAVSRWLVRLPMTTTIYGASFPVGLVYPLTVALIIGVALVYVATLQMHALLRWIGWAVTSLLLVLGSAGLVWEVPGLIVIPAAAAAVLAVLTALRRRRFRPWELVAAIAVIGGCWSLVWLIHQLVEPGIATSLVTAMVGFLQPFILPLAVIAGLALAEIAVAVAHGTVRAVATEIPGVPWTPVVTVLAVAAVLVNARQDTGWTELAWSVGVVAAGVGGWLGLGALGRRQPAPRPAAAAPAGQHSPGYDPEPMWNGFRTQVWWIAVGVCVPFFVSGVLTIAGVTLPGLADRALGPEILRLNARFLAAGVQVQFGLVALGALVGSLVLWARGDLVRARVSWIAAVIAGALTLDQLRMPYAAGWTSAGLALVIVLLVVGTVAGLRAYSQFTERAAVACSAALAICLLYPLRGGLADPVTAVVGTTLASVLLLSSVWQLLTEGSVTRGNSAAVPRVGRLLFFLGYQVLWVLSAVALVVSREPRFADLAVGIDIGDRLLGTTLLVAACAGLLTIAVSGTTLGRDRREVSR